jgi:hypothetical protein
VPFCGRVVVLLTTSPLIELSLTNAITLAISTGRNRGIGIVGFDGGTPSVGRCPIEHLLVVSKIEISDRECGQAGEILIRLGFYRKVRY